VATTRTLAKWRTFHNGCTTSDASTWAFAKDAARVTSLPSGKTRSESDFVRNAEVSGDRDNPLGIFYNRRAGGRCNQPMKAYPGEAEASPSAERSRCNVVRTDAGTNLCWLGQRSSRTTVSIALKVAYACASSPFGAGPTPKLEIAMSAMAR
jgi:hypothetical protein